MTKRTASGDDGNHYFGYSVGLDGDTLTVGRATGCDDLSREGDGGF